MGSSVYGRSARGSVRVCAASPLSRAMNERSDANRCDGRARRRSLAGTGRDRRRCGRVATLAFATQRDHQRRAGRRRTLFTTSDVARRNRPPRDGLQPHRRRRNGGAPAAWNDGARGPAEWTAASIPRVLRRNGALRARAGLQSRGRHRARSGAYASPSRSVGEVRPSNLETRAGCGPATHRGHRSAGCKPRRLGRLQGAAAGGDDRRSDAGGDRTPSRVAQGRWLGASAHVHAMMDLSDGLSTDLGAAARALLGHRGRRSHYVPVAGVQPKRDRRAVWCRRAALGARRRRGLRTAGCGRGARL